MAALLVLPLLAARQADAAGNGSAPSLCAARACGTEFSWANGELVAHWQTSAASGDDHRLGSVLTRPILAAALYSDPALIPNAQPLPKEILAASVHLNAVTAIDEKNSFFEGDGELVRSLPFSPLSAREAEQRPERAASARAQPLQPSHPVPRYNASQRLTWYDERLCFDTTHWQPTPEPDCRCDHPPCKCVFLRGEDLVDFTKWMWIPETAVKGTHTGYSPPSWFPKMVLRDCVRLQRCRCGTRRASTRLLTRSSG